MATVSKSGFAEFLFPSEASGQGLVKPGKVDLVNPAIVGFSEDEFSLVMVDTSGENPTYVGVTRAGGLVVLSPVSGERQLLQRVETEQSNIETTDLYRSAMYRLYAEKSRQIRLLSIIFFLSIVASVSGLSIVWPVMRTYFANGVTNLTEIGAAVACLFLVFCALRVLHQTIRSIVLD